MIQIFQKVLEKATCSYNESFRKKKNSYEEDYQRTRFIFQNLMRDIKKEELVNMKLGFGWIDKKTHSLPSLTL